MSTVIVSKTTAGCTLVVRGVQLIGMDRLIELSKTGCSDCEHAKPIVHNLEKEGYTFEKYMISEPKGQELVQDYFDEINENSRRMGYEEGYIYTPTFINPKNRKLIGFIDRPPTREELIELATSSD